MLIRTIVAIIFGPLIIYLSYVGGMWLLGLILVLAGVGISEFVIQSLGKNEQILLVLSVLFTGGLILSSALLDFSTTLMIYITYLLLIGMILSMRSQPPANLFNKIILLSWGVAYVGLLYPFVYHIRELTATGNWLLFLFGTIWLSDSMAMWIGKAFGKRKLAPTVSPNKTIAGFVGGLSGGIIIALILNFWLLPEFSIINLIFAGLLVSFVGQLGDLVESCWKRSLGIKDSSAIIPGHGGVLDRFDSLLFAAPVLFFYLKYFLFR
jgi:phosphatidate cytidylyltransferase